jgi:hypothetical protein
VGDVRSLVALDQCACVRSRSSERPGAVGDWDGCEKSVADLRAHFTHELPHGPQLADGRADYEPFDRPGRRKLVARGDQSPMHRAPSIICIARTGAAVGLGCQRAVRDVRARTLHTRIAARSAVGRRSSGLRAI